MATETFEAVGLNLPWKEYIIESEKTWEIPQPDLNLVEQVSSVFEACSANTSAKAVRMGMDALNKERSGCESLDEPGVKAMAIRKWESIQLSATARSNLRRTLFEVDDAASQGGKGAKRPDDAMEMIRMMTEQSDDEGDPCDFKDI